MRNSSEILRLILLSASLLLSTHCSYQPRRMGYNRNTASWSSKTAEPSREYSERKLSTSPLDQAVRPWMGTPYLYGGNNRKGIDCSGFVLQVFRKYKGIELPHNTKMAWKMGKSIDQDELQKGDVLFFGNIFGVSHNAIYMGEGRFVHASSSKGVSFAKMKNSYWAPRYKGARRY